MPQSQAALTFAQWGRHPRLSPFPSMVVSKHMLSAKKTPICGINKVDQSVTARYNFVVEPGLPVSPLQGGPAFLLPAPGPMQQGVSYVQISASYIRKHKTLWRELPVGGPGRSERGNAELRVYGVLRSSLSYLPRSYTGSTQESVQRPQPRPCVSISTVVRLERWMCFLVAERGRLPLREIANARATRGRIVR